jgi:DNA-cytosine methyltransferase
VDYLGGVMIVLSLFDGMSCGRAALESAGFAVDKYFASEIDKYAMAVSAYNYSDIIQIGDVCKVDVKTLPKIDLIMAGSPCQGFSLAGKQLNFNDPRSALFFEFVRVLKEAIEINPDVKFLLENVKMKREYQDKISDIMGCNPIVINSALVSAQNRVRLYWTNIEVVGLPEDRGILLKDILEDDVPEKYFLSEKSINGIKEHKKRHKENGNGFGASISDGNTKSGTILSRYYKDGKDSLIITHNLQPRNGKGLGGKGHLQKEDGKSYCVETGNAQAIEMNYRIRRLTPGECESLQTMPKGYTAKGMMNGKEVAISDTQRYRMLGNGWTRDVIAFILQFMDENKVKEAKAKEPQTTLFDIIGEQ